MPSRGTLHLTRSAAVATVVGLISLLAHGHVTHDPHDPRVKGGTDGAGSLPKTTTPTQTNGPSFPVKLATLGRVLDASTHQPIAGALLVVTASDGSIAGLAFTDDEGIFVVYLFAVPGLELAIPSEGVVGVEVEAGQTLTTFVQ
jgi:hypothetical protein